MPEIDFAKFRINLKLAREIKDMTAKELSIAAGLKQQKRIADIEEGRGKPTLEEVDTICHNLGQPMDYMLNNTAEKTLNWKYKLVTWQGL